MIDRLLDQYGENYLQPLTRDWFSDFPTNWGQEDGPQASVRMDTSISKVQTRAREGSHALFLDKYVRQQTTCVAPRSAVRPYKKGVGSRPKISWWKPGENMSRFNPNSVPTITDYLTYAAWYSAVYASPVVAKFSPAYRIIALGLEDGIRALGHYLTGNGRDLEVNYEKAIRQSKTIRDAVNAEENAVKEAVQKMHDGLEKSFSFHTKDLSPEIGAQGARHVPCGSFDCHTNWFAALGGHRIWSAGKVNYDSKKCELNVAYKIMVEDFYNFNENTFGYKNLAHLAVVGFADVFFSRNAVSRSATIKLDCCDDSECSRATDLKCKCNRCRSPCSIAQRSGGFGLTEYEVDVGKTQGKFGLRYDMYFVPDELKIWHEGKIIFSTKGPVSGRKTVTVSYGSVSSTSSVIDVAINGQISGTRWSVDIQCAT